jgi:acetylornithine deacetylase/succinyl-diaminopimelate desuccinylase-like protein
VTGRSISRPANSTKEVFVRRSILFFVVLALSGVPLAAQQTAAAPTHDIDWDALNREAVTILADYLKLDTSNPPGNEMRGIHFLKGILEREGFEVQVLDTGKLGATRGNLYTRLRGNGSKRAIALVHHIDVVPATPSYWTVPPFSGAIRDGYVYGRGALDMKGEGTTHLMAMIALKRSGARLNRDIVFIANADEELTSTGAIEFVAAHPELLRDVEFLITEGGDNPVRNGRLEYFGVSVAEKRTFWQRITVKGVPSHGSRPTKQNPVPRLVAAVHRVAQYETPLHVTAGVAKYFRDISRNYTGEQRTWLADVRTAIRTPRARTWLTNDVYWNAILRNTITPTGLYGSDKTNVIPPEASAVIDIRLLPDQSADSVLATLKRIVNDSAVTWQTLLAPKAPLENPVDTDLFRAIERASRERDSTALVTTPMLTGATDRPTYRKAGIITYGLDPFRVESTDSQRGVHGNDERVSVENVGFGVRYVYDILRYVQ